MDFLAGGDIDDVIREIRQFVRERRREVVAAAFDEYDVEVGKAFDELLDGGVVGAGVFAGGGVWTSTGFEALNAFRSNGVVAHQALGVFAGIDVVRDDADSSLFAQRLAQGLQKCRLAAADGAADTDTDMHVIPSVHAISLMKGRAGVYCSTGACIGSRACRATTRAPAKPSPSRRCRGLPPWADVPKGRAPGQSGYNIPRDVWGQSGAAVSSCPSRRSSGNG